MSEICKNYLDCATKMLRLIKEHQEGTQEVKDLQNSCADYWSKMTDDEQCYVGEMEIRINQWI